MPTPSPSAHRIILSPGEHPIEGYTLVKRLGDGGAGEVWLASTPGGWHNAALKFLRLDRPLARAEAGHLERLKRVQHEHLLRVLMSWETSDYMILHMELAQGSLADELTAHRRAGEPGIPAGKLLDYLRQAALGIDYLNVEKNMVHRDVKPANLLLVNGVLKVADFGLATALDASAGTNTGGYTANYAAPELFTREKTPWTDQYALAVTYCELLSGQFPFTGNVNQVMFKHAYDPPDLTMLAEAERLVVNRALAKDPTHRWSTCSEFIAELTKLSAQPARVRLRPLSPLTVTAGHGAEVIIEVDRESCPSALEVTVSGLPAGVEATPIAVPAGATEVRLRLQTGPDALPGRRSILVGVRAGSVSDEQELALTIRAAVVERLIVRVPDAVDLRTGQISGIKIAVVREHVTGDVRLEWKDLPAGVRPDKADLVVPANQDETTLSLCASWGARDDSIVRLVAQIGGLDAQAVARLHINRIAPPKLDSTGGGLEMAAVRQAQHHWAEYLGVKIVETIDLGGVKMQAQLVPPGKFWMGSPDDDDDAFTDEKPRHKVKISQPFFISRTPVTIGQFRAFVESSRHQCESETDGEGGWGYSEAWGGFEMSRSFSWKNTGWQQSDDHPVVNVTWGDAHKFVRWLRRVTSLVAQLPTEDEWEYACRAGTTTRYYSGDSATSLEGFANVADVSFRRARPDEADKSTAFDFDDGFPFTSPVAKYKPNHLGLFDMIGNVWEWCADGVRDYRTEVKADPALGRITRGGCWDTGPAYCRIATRGRQFPSYRSHFVGFRIAFHLPSEPITVASRTTQP